MLQAVNISAHSTRAGTPCISTSAAKMAAAAWSSSVRAPITNNGSADRQVGANCSVLRIGSLAADVVVNSRASLLASQCS